MSSTDYKIRLEDNGKFKLDFFIKTDDSKFNWAWKKAIKKLEKRRLKIEKSPEQLKQFSVKQMKVPRNMLSFFENIAKKPVRRTLNKVRKNAEKQGKNFVFHDFELDNGIYKKVKKEWWINLKFEGDYSND